MNQKKMCKDCKFNVFENIELLKHNKYQKFLLHNGMSRPIMLICETVNICNYNCIFCSYSMMTRKKSIMPMELFEHVLKEYTEIGGGFLSLTPMLGDIFLDKLLLERLRLIKKYPSIKNLSFTTNAVFSDQYNDEELRSILKNSDKILISIYGINPEEHKTITKHDDYRRAMNSISRMLDLVDNRKKIIFHLRLLNEYNDVQIRNWIHTKFGTDVDYGKISRYANWGGALKTEKDFALRHNFIPAKNNTSTCVIPLAACQVFSNGDISFCPCADFNGTGVFHLGNIMEQPLEKIYNAKKTKTLWSMGNRNRLPNICIKCTFHRPLSDLPKRYEFMFEDPLSFIGG